MMQKKFIGLVLSIFYLLPNIVFAAPISPLAPIKLDSPRETMRTFMNAMNDYRRGKETGDAALLEHLEIAIQCLNTQEGALQLHEEAAKEAAIFLKEVIDRIILINYELIPEVLPPGTSSWRLKDTGITIAKVENGENGGRYLFTKQTVRNARRYFELVKHLPYLPESGNGALYEEPWLEKNVPNWAKKTIIVFPNWKWVVLFIAILFGYFVRKAGEKIVRIFRRMMERAHLRWEVEALSAAEVPLGLMLSTGFGYLVVSLIGFDGIVGESLVVFLKVAFSAEWIWILYRLTDVIMRFWSERMANTQKSIDTHVFLLLQKSIQIVVLLFGGLIIFQNLGINVMSLVAGLGLGGLAFALAAKDTCANLLGSLMIVLDHSYKVGDEVKIGSIGGIVEEVGLRSTRIRTPANSLVSIPNSIVANENVDNIGRKNFTRVINRIGLPFGTPPEKIEVFLGAVRKIILENPYTFKQRGDCHVYVSELRVEYIEVTANFIIKTPNLATEHEEKQSIYLKILNAAQELGVQFAIPSRAIYVESLPSRAISS